MTLAIALGAAADRFGGVVRGIRFTVPAPLLASGLMLVDTPSMSGGISSAIAGIVLAELMQCQAWMLVTDASQELTGPELELIKVGSSLCPVVLVVATKCDLTPHWRRIVQIDEQHLQRLDLAVPPAVIPTACTLRTAAVRLGDAQLDRESGLPLLTWYLTRATTVTARAGSARFAARALVSELESLEQTITDEIDVILNSGERARILDESRRSRERCEHLSTTARPAVDRATRGFQREVQRDLQDRIETLRRTTMDDLARLRDEREWAKIEQRTQTEVNRLLAEHLRFISDSVELAVAGVAKDLSIESGDLDIAEQVVMPSHGNEHLTAQLNPPVLPKPGIARLQPALISARVGVTGASGVALGLSSGLLAGVAAVAGVAMVPIAALGAGWWVRQRNRENEAVPWRRQAEIELNRFLTDCHHLIARCSEDVCDDVLGQLPALLERRLRELAQQFAAELERLTALANDRSNMHRAEVERLDGQRDEIRLLASHARRIEHRLDSPVITLPLRSSLPQNMT